MLFTGESQFQLYRADGRQSVRCHMGKRFADINIVNRVLHGGGGIMVWAGISYGQRTQLHFIDFNLYAQRYPDEIPRPIVVQFIHHHLLMFQHDNAQPAPCRKDLYTISLHTHQTCHPGSLAVKSVGPVTKRLLGRIPESAR